MGSYTIMAADGQTYGPADEATLVQWAREGRITPNTGLCSVETGQQFQAHNVPALAPFVGLSPAMVHALAQPGQQMVGAPIPLQYGEFTPGGNIDPRQHGLTDFNVAGVVCLHFLTLGIFTWLHFLLMHGKLPRTRMDDPSAGKAIGFCFIPFFNIYWIIFVHLRLIDRINEQRGYRNLPPASSKGLYITSVCLSFVPILGLVSLVLLPIFYGGLQSSVNELSRVTWGRQG
jgi:hypothetical protein